MALEIDKLSLIAGPLDGKGQVWAYTGSDTGSTLNGSGYWVGATKRGLRAGDMILATAGATIHIVTSISGAGNGTAATKSA
jgi:hypothetical protein